MSPGFEVLATGPLTLVQDLGRPGLADVGVGRSGAADRGAFRLGARLLAQEYSAAALEVTFGGLQVRAAGDLTVALTGADAPATVDGRLVDFRSPLRLRDGQTLRLGTPPVGLRSYLSVRGGVDVAPVLGSRSTDLLSGLGPPPVQVGDRLAVGPPPARFPCVDVAPTAPLEGGSLLLHALPGPRDDWLADRHDLTATVWTVSSRSDRVGIRLEGEPLAYAPSPDRSGTPQRGCGAGRAAGPGRGPTCPVPRRPPGDRRLPGRRRGGRRGRGPRGAGPPRPGDPDRAARLMSTVGDRV